MNSLKLSSRFLGECELTDGDHQPGKMRTDIEHLRNRQPAATVTLRGRRDVGPDVAMRQTGKVSQ